VIFPIESTGKQKECRSVNLERGTLNLSTRTACVKLSCIMQDLLIISTNYQIYELTNNEVWIRIKMEKNDNLKNDLADLGLLDKAREICSELDEKAAVSYIKSSYRQLSKVYHPDINPKHADRARELQKKLNRLNESLKRVEDRDLVELIQGNDDLKPESAKKKILVVEDEFGMLQTLRDVFQMEGYDVRIAVDGVKGYKAYRKFKPDLIFTDIVMPKMNGLELVSKIRETDPKIKVIYNSGFFGVRPLKDAMAEEVQKYNYPVLPKPTKLSVMLALVKEYLEA